MTHHSPNFRVRYYPDHGEWTLYVQRVDAEGVPQEDVLTTVGSSKDEARAKALEMTTDAEIREAIELAIH